MQGCGLDADNIFPDAVHGKRMVTNAGVRLESSEES
jgi:hypothetical protein